MKLNKDLVLDKKTNIYGNEIIEQLIVINNRLEKITEILQSGGIVVKK